MTLKRIAIGFAATPPLPAALWAFSLWRDHGSPGMATLGGTFLSVLPGAYLTMAVVGVPAFLLARRIGGWIAHLFMGVLAVWLVELLYLTLVSLSESGLSFSDLPSVFAVVVADAASHGIASLLLPALYGVLAGLVFHAVTRAKPEPFIGRFS